MTCPHDNRACTAPRCAVCPLVELSEPAALAALFVVAALCGGTVNQLWRFTDDMRDGPGNFGYGVLSAQTWPVQPIWMPHSDPLWMWRREDRLFGSMIEVDIYVYPGGRIDRGLGAIRPGTKTAPGAALEDAARGGDQAPTD